MNAPAFLDYRARIESIYSGPPAIERNEPFKVLPLPRSIYDQANASAYPSKAAAKKAALEELG